MLASTICATLQGVDAIPVTVEANGGEKGEPRCVLVGLPDAAVKEALDRVYSSISNSGFSIPRTRVTINLAPGDLKKEGTSFDLPIATTLLAAIDDFQCSQMGDYLIAGELGLSGEVRGIRGSLAMAVLARKLGKKGIILPYDSAWEASLVEGLSVHPVKSLAETIDFLSGKIEIEPLVTDNGLNLVTKSKSFDLDFDEIRGQLNVKRAVEISVAGGHNLLIVGPPGSGKSMVAKRIPTILPPPCIDEYLEILTIFSVGGLASTIQDSGLTRPIRTPHHTISDVGLLGGGAKPGPGEISLAHNGVLFLDELPEFKRSALEVLRQPIEDGVVTISRSAGKITLPCQFMLVAAMNPCPCGYLGDDSNQCRCSIPQIQKYRNKISGPLLDRIDLHVEAPAVRVSDLKSEEKSEQSSVIRERVVQCRGIQEKRYKNISVRTKTNANMTESLVNKFCKISTENMDLLSLAMERMSLSARAYSRILKVSRTIADMAGANDIEREHLLEAIQYRNLDRSLY